MQLGPTSAPLPIEVSGARSDNALRQAAQQLEAGFLAEMLRATGIGKPPQSFGGGAGEAQFSSYLVQHYADTLVAGGGIGLSEQIFNALKEKSK